MNSSPVISAAATIAAIATMSMPGSGTCSCCSTRSPPRRRRPRECPSRRPEGCGCGYAIGLDLSGHVGYANNVAQGFTDSSGFVFGKGNHPRRRSRAASQTGRRSSKKRRDLAALHHGTVDWRFDYSHVAYFPTQVALAGGDAVNFSDATTFVGAQVGLDVRMANGWTVGAQRILLPFLRHRNCRWKGFL